MLDHPIVFTGPSVRALLAGRKTQTRLLANKLRKARLQRVGAPDAVRLTPSMWRDTRIGDRYWVRESLGWDKAAERLFYRADGASVIGGPPGQRLSAAQMSSRYMPRWASRLTLIVIGMRIEPIQALTEAGALAEGIEPLADGCFRADHYDPLTYASAALAYAQRWSSFNSRPGTRWDDNPEVVVMTFEVERSDLISDCALSSA